MSWNFEDQDPFEDMIPLVVDFGSQKMKVGYSGDDAPRSVYPTVMGYPKKPDVGGMYHCDYIHGDEAMAKKDMFDLKYPMPIDGRDMDYKMMEEMIGRSLYLELKTPYEEHAFLFPAFHKFTKNHFKWLPELMFETHNIPGLLFCDSSLLSLYASGRTNGVVLESGYGTTKATCFYEGLPVHHSLIKSERKFHLEKRIGGAMVSDRLRSLLSKRGDMDEMIVTSEIIDDMKEKLCYVCLDPLEEEKKMDIVRHEYRLPDEVNSVVLESERYLAPEILFNPSIVYPDLIMDHKNNSILPVHELVYQSTKRCDRDNDIQVNLTNNVVLSGGNTMFEGFSDRMSQELTKLYPLNRKIRVNAPAERKFSVWIGGSILGCLSTTYSEKLWVLKEEYEENGGSRICELKCSPWVICEKEFSMKREFRDPDVGERLEYVLSEMKFGEEGIFTKIELRNLRIEVKSVHRLVM